MEKKYGIILLIMTFILLMSCGGNENEENNVPEIEVYSIHAQKVVLYKDFVGSISGIKDISVRARVPGFLEGIHFKEGGRVKKGQLLYTIESQQYEAQAAAQLSKLAEAKTNLAHAKSELARIKPLAENNAVSKSDLDAAIANYDAAKAMVEAAKANLKAANIQLSYTKVRSHIDGIIGKTKAKVGSFVGQSPNPVILNVVSKIDTMLVEFYLTEADYLKIFKEVFQNKKKNENIEKKPLRLILSDGTIYPEIGTVRFIDRGVDSQTGAILVQASFPNPSGLLRPGLFGKIRAQTAVIPNGILVPQRCVTELQGRHSVFIVNSENKIEQKKVDLGETVGSFWLVQNGLQEGDRVVYEGLQKVKSGITVNPVEAKLSFSTEKVGK